MLKKLFSWLEKLYIFIDADTQLHLAVSVGRFVGLSDRLSVRHIFEFLLVVALLLLPNRLGPDTRLPQSRAGGQGP